MDTGASLHCLTTDFYQAELGAPHYEQVLAANPFLLLITAAFIAELLCFVVRPDEFPRGAKRWLALTANLAAVLAATTTVALQSLQRVTELEDCGYGGQVVIWALNGQAWSLSSTREGVSGLDLYLVAAIAVVALLAMLASRWWSPTARKVSGTP